MPSRLSRCALAASLCTALAAPAVADPTVGIGLTVTFGGGSPQVGAGVRVFSDNDEDEFVASIGLDYMFTGGGFRPSIGAVYLLNNSYLGLDVGYNLSAGSIDFGASGGAADTEDDDNGGGGGGNGNDGGTDIGDTGGDGGTAGGDF